MINEQSSVSKGGNFSIKHVELIKENNFES